ncbi:hypothetical protein HY643_02070 [Candidatus Woesearchaeota archaeon]|nr:hypothetical protein [Candidatus Woesearchaeota archaeon]
MSETTKREGESECVQDSQIQLKKLLEVRLRREEGGPVVLGDVSKWEKIDPMTLLVAKKLNLNFNETYLPLLNKGEAGLYALIFGKYYQKKAQDEGLKKVVEDIEALLQKADTTLEQLELYAVHTFKDFPNQKEIVHYAKTARKEAPQLEQKVKFYTHPFKWCAQKFNKTSKDNANKSEPQTDPEITSLISKTGEALEESLKEFYKEIEGKKYSFEARLEDIHGQKIYARLSSKRKKAVIEIINPGRRMINIYDIALMRESNHDIKIILSDFGFSFGGLYGGINETFNRYVESYGKKTDHINEGLYILAQIPKVLSLTLSDVQQKETERQEKLKKNLKSVLECAQSGRIPKK